MGAFFSASFLPEDKSSIVIAVSSLLVATAMTCFTPRNTPMIYDWLILHMTEVWYRAVLTRVKEGTNVLDIGIGTAGALLRCKDVLISKNISVVGIDYNELYIKAAQKSIEENNLQSSIQVEFKSVYDIPTSPPVLISLSNNTNTSQGSSTTSTSSKKKFDAAYFSGSISLLPDPLEALRAVAEVVKPNGLIYVPQTYQRRTFPFLKYIKPMLKFLTSVDFGQLVMVDEVEDLLWKGSGLEVIEHEIIPGSVNNYLQAAYLTVLRVPYAAV